MIAAASGQAKPRRGPAPASTGSREGAAAWSSKSGVSILYDGLMLHSMGCLKACAAFLLLACCAAGQTNPARVARLMERAIVIDLHDDTTQMIVDEGYDLAQKHDYGQVDIPRMRAG